MAVREDTSPAIATIAINDTCDQTMARLTKQASPDRSKIAMQSDDEVKYWTKHFGVSREELQCAVEKVGNSVASVRKELGK